jgi:hypothetical protein
MSVDKFNKAKKYYWQSKGKGKTEVLVIHLRCIRRTISEISTIPTSQKY